MVLPTETLVDVFGFLDYKTSAKLLLVSKRCNAILTQQMALQAEKLLEVYNDLTVQLDALKAECEEWYFINTLLQQSLNSAHASIFDFTFILDNRLTNEENRPIIISALRRMKQLKEVYERNQRWYKSRQTTLSEQLCNLVDKMRDVEQRIPHKTKDLIEKNAERIKRAQKALK